MGRLTSDVDLFLTVAVKTLNGVIGIILLYFTEFDNFAGLILHSDKDRPILSAEYHLPLLAKTDPPCNAISLR